MVEAIITALIVVGAAFWFVRWLRGSATGERGCSCGGCDKKCPSREAEHGS